jgi:hypothetical protein
MHLSFDWQPEVERCARGPALRQGAAMGLEERPGDCQATLLVLKAELHARHEIRCRTGLQSTDAQSM